MTALWQRLVMHTEVGLAVGEREVAACEVASTLFGRVELSRVSVPCTPDNLGEALARLLASWTRREILARSRVSIGLPTLRVFFSSRSIQATHREVTPLTLLHEVIQSPTLNLDDMVVDLIQPKVGGKPLASLVSCRKRYLAGVMGALDSAQVRPDRAEPAPCAMVRVAAWKHRSPRKVRSLVRVFLGPGEGLAVLTSSDDLPLMWRPFALTAGAEATAILTAIASVRVLGGFCGLRGDIDAVLIQGRADLGALADVSTSAALRGVRVYRLDQPDLNEANVALGLALAPGPGVASFNLIRSLVGRNKLRHIFPWGQVALQCAILLAASLFLHGRLTAAQTEQAQLQADGSKYAWSNRLSLGKLQAEKKTLEERVGAVQSFLSGRALWTNLSRALAHQLTPELALSSIQGFYELEPLGGKGNKPRRSLIVRVSAPIPQTEKLPPAIEAFVRQVRADKTLNQLFPEVDLTDLRSVQATNKTTNASFGVTFRPAKVGAAPKPARADATKAR